MRRVYIVLSTRGVGGAEKRFTDNWHHLCGLGLDVHLVLDKTLHSQLARQAGYAEKLRPSSRLHVIDFAGGRYLNFCSAVSAFFRTQPARCIVHYPLAYCPFVQTRHHHRLLLSWVNSTMPSFRGSQWKNAVNVWTAFYAADHVDVLSPGNLRRIERFNALAKKTSLTKGGTVVDSRVYRPLAKKLDFAFVGRFEPEKQVLRFVSALPEVHRILESAGVSGYRFVLCGEGVDGDGVRALVQSAAFCAVPVEIGYSSAIEQVLGESAVFFSLQRSSNYPSKALAEAMSCGAYPVLTEVGESYLMVEGSSHYRFIPRDFTSDDVANALLAYLSLSLADRESVALTTSDYAAHRFSADTQSQYFANLYSKLSV